jgi:asparagine synthase (glutamine-hydrolysing)
VCGICGWIGNKPSETPAHLWRMVEALRPRGPDGCGEWRSLRHPAALGHTRLSIIDLAGSNQPMANEDGTIIVTYNGEIYNFPELRAELLARGHQFRSRGDTEVLVHLYEEWGAPGVERLDGMFAFGLYDDRRHTLLLARDRIGIKPLYYWHHPVTGELLFSSDMASLMANPAVPRRLNRRALSHYLHFGYAVAPDTWLAEAGQLEPGEMLLWSEGQVRRTRYYQWGYSANGTLGDPGVALASLNDALSDSVARQLVADVPLGSFLSGGLDSSTVTGLAQQHCRTIGSSVKSFTVRCRDTELDESLRARSIAAGLQTRHTEILAEDLAFSRETVDALVTALGEPFGDTSALAVYQLCLHAREHVKVALSGDGGDELFLGYGGMWKQRFARSLRLAPMPLRQALATLPANSTQAWPRWLGKYARLSLRDDRYVILDWSRRWEWHDLAALLGGDLFQLLFPNVDDAYPEVALAVGRGKEGGFLEQQIQFHMLVDLPGDCLLKVDRMSMAHGLEVRVPVLSNRMLQYGAELPLSRRWHGRRTKEPLRTLAERLAPTVAQRSPKRGFDFPIDHWRRDLAVHWREWEISAALARIGFQADELDALVSRFEAVALRGRSYEIGALTVRLMDLLLLGLWVERYAIVH